MCPKALIVEDEPAARALLAQLMEGLGFEVDLAADGEIAMSLLSARDYELILLDIVLPKVSGIEVMESLRAERGHLLGRIIVVTGLNILEIRSLFPTVHETLSKPVFPSRLREAVRSCVAPRAAARHAVTNK